MESETDIYSVQISNLKFMSKRSQPPKKTVAIDH
jgi:hypothetical protein